MGLNTRKKHSASQGIVASADLGTTSSREIFFSVDPATLDYLDGDIVKSSYPSSHYIEFDPAKLLQYLSDLEAEIFWLLFVKKKNQKDVALLLKVSQPTVSYRYRRILEKLSYLLVLSGVDVDGLLRKIDFLKDKERDIMRDLFFYVNQEKVGKKFGVRQALELGTPMLTKDGWKTMGTLVVGDWVRHPFGGWTEVDGKSEITTEDTYEISFQGTKEKIRADGKHLWKVFIRDLRGLKCHRTGRREWVQERWEYEVLVRTEDLASKVKTEAKDSLFNFRVPLTEPLVGGNRSLPVDPYVFGVWLGDGVTNNGYLCIWEEELRDLVRGKLPDLKKMKSEGRYKSGILQRSLREMGFATGPHAQRKTIPRSYLTCSAEQRLELLRGLIDTDGTQKEKTARVGYSSSSKSLAMDVWELVLGLGIKSALSESKLSQRGKEFVSWRLDFTPSERVGYLVRKSGFNSDSRSRYWRVEKIEKVAPLPAQCITVTARDGMYLAGRSLIPTHNSSVKWIFVKTLNRLDDLERREPEKWGRQYSMFLLLDRNLGIRVLQ